MITLIPEEEAYPFLVPGVVFRLIEDDMIRFDYYQTPLTLTPTKLTWSQKGLSEQLHTCLSGGHHTIKHTPPNNEALAESLPDALALFRRYILKGMQDIFNRKINSKQILESVFYDPFVVGDDHVYQKALGTHPKSGLKVKFVYGFSFKKNQILARLEYEGTVTSYDGRTSFLELLNDIAAYLRYNDMFEV